MFFTFISNFWRTSIHVLGLRNLLWRTGVFTNLYIALDITMIPRIASLSKIFFFFDVIEIYYWRAGCLIQ
jgi:hypothetical protein